MGGDLGALQQHVGLGVGKALRNGGLDQGDKLFLLLGEHGRLEKFWVSGQGGDLADGVRPGKVTGIP
ncbi:hypothetical protein QWC_12638 [Achromobacter marplatensis]|nr:hypothetical protein QWC_12638 [Achromobacter marplatensis]